ncbi:unnamed protein product [Oreochromis niloticus]|nr:unnamed protein product [Mustela putorius furo]
MPSKVGAFSRLFHSKKGDFLLEYRGKLRTKEECERRHRVYHDSLKVFMFEFKFDGKL